MTSIHPSNRHRFWPLLRCFLVGAAFCLPLSLTTAAEKQPLSRGEFVFRATGGCSCHTDFQNKGQRLAGGRSLKTPYGPIYSSNITTDKSTGIGNWQAADFIRAMQQGVGPGGKKFYFLEKHYFPVFPYTAFTKIREPDLVALWEYLQTVPPVVARNKPHDMMPPFGWRINLIVWKWFNFTSGEFTPNPAQSEEWNQGAYLVKAMAHCEECHSPRNLMGGLKHDQLFIGSKDGPEGELAPNITPDKTTGIGNWKPSDLSWFLKTGQKPDGDFAWGLMSEVIFEGYQFLDTADLDHIVRYIMSQTPVQHKVR